MPDLNPDLQRQIRRHKESRSPYRYMLTRWAWRCPFCGFMNVESKVTQAHIEEVHSEGKGRRD